MQMKSRNEIFAEIMSEYGRKGGKIGGKKAAANMTPEQRTARAKKAAAASAVVRSAKAKARAADPAAPETSQS